MFRQVKVYAYDCLDRVVVTVRYQETSDAGTDVRDWVTLVATDVQGTGEPDGRSWVSDALIAALEAL